MKKKKSNVLLISLICLAIVVGVLAYKELKPIIDALLQKEELKTAVEDDKDPWNRVIDFKKLKSINGDIVGWLYIPNTSVDYPILIGDTDDEYLYRDIKGNYSVLGSIFAPASASRDLSDARTVLYGHNMLHYQMFGELKRFYRDEDFRKEHDKFYVYTEDKTMELSIFSIFSCNEADSIISGYKDIESEGYTELVDKIYFKNQYFDINGVDRIGDYYNKQMFSLVTCKGRVGTSERLLVNGLVEREKSAR